MPEDEGQHLQHVYASAYKIGGMLNYAFHSQARLFENHTKANQASRDELYEAWAPYWDVRKRVLIEKSPRHVVMTRFLQQVFLPSKTYFVVTIKHPIGAAHFWWSKKTRAWSVKKDCGRHIIRHWLQIYESLREDISSLHHVHVIQAERALGGQPSVSQRIFDHLFYLLGLPPTVNLHFSTDALAPGLARQHGRSRRELRVGQGDKVSLVIHLGQQLNWIAEWNELVDMTSPVCQQVAEDYETALNFFGYSFRNPRAFKTPPAFSDYVLH